MAADGRRTRKLGHKVRLAEGPEEIACTCTEGAGRVRRRRGLNRPDAGRHARTGARQCLAIVYLDVKTYAVGRRAPDPWFRARSAGGKMGSTRDEYSTRR